METFIDRTEDGTDGAGRNNIIDSKVFLEEARLFGNELMRDIIDEFLSIYPLQIGIIEGCVLRGEYRELELSTHKLGNTVAYFYADSAYKAAGSLEKSARNQEPEKIESAYKQLCCSMEQLIRELKEIRVIL